MPLIDDAQTVSQRLRYAESARDNIGEAMQLTMRRNELQQHEQRLKALAARQSLLIGESIKPAPVDGIADARSTLLSIATAFGRERKAATLTQGQRWNNLISDNGLLDQVKTNARARQIEAWKAHCSNLFGGLPPAEIQQAIVPGLPENRAALALYTRLYQEFTQYRNRVPDTANTVKQVRELARELREIRFVMNNDVPEAVRRFFAATLTGTGANLDLLTIDVIDWLRKNQMLANYVVRTR